MLHFYHILSSEDTAQAHLRAVRLIMITPAVVLSIAWCGQHLDPDTLRVSVVGWEKFYPKGKGRRNPDRKANEGTGKQDDGMDKVQPNLSNAIGSLLGPIIFAVAANALWNSYRGDDKVSIVGSAHAAI